MRVRVIRAVTLARTNTGRATVVGGFGVVITKTYDIAILGN